MFAVMSVSELAQVSDPLRRAIQANELMWTNHPDRAGLRSARAHSIREALANGQTAEDVAAGLGVIETDLVWMTSEAASWPYRNGRPTYVSADPTLSTEQSG